MAVESAVLITIGTSLASGLLKALLQKSVNALSESSSAAGLKSALFGNLKPQILDLKQELEKLETFLCCAESLNPVQINHNALMRHWLIKIKEAANFADNLLDDISYDQLRRQVESNMVSNLFLCGSDGSLAFRVKIGRKLSKFKSMAAEIYDEADRIGVKPVELLANPASYQPPTSMSNDLREMRENGDSSIVVGRQVDEDLIVGELSRPNNDQVLGVIAIVGMSGIGKTTLARKIYDNKIMTEHYKNKAWIFVSDHFNLRRLLDEMLQSLTGVSLNLSNTEAMEKKLRECLQMGRYLLVLDDVWNTNKQVWDSIRSSLVRVTGGCMGSMVLVTTQSFEVASVMGASLTRSVELLSNDDAWTLFVDKAFANKSQQQVSNLRIIGESILRKCRGLPLAINTLASLLGTMNERSEWESVDRSQVWNLPEGQTTIMPWLLLSFNHLPNAAVKQCFAHCSIMLPKGQFVHEGSLIASWIAQGFIQQSETSELDYMAIGRPYLKSMLASGLLRLYYRSNYISRFISMHDLIHDLAVYVSGDKYLTVNDLHKASSGVEHLSVYGGNTSNSQRNFPNGNTHSMLRTLLCFKASISIDLVVQARFLRHLKLTDCGLKEIPRSIGRLKHLRILDLNNNPIEYLAETIGSLYNLQILSLESCNRLVELPQQVTKLLNLRAFATTEAVPIPKGLGQLACLLQLPIVKLMAHDGRRIKELGSLKHLMGRVTITQLENISCKEDVVEAGLKTKAGITDLKLAWTSERYEDGIVCSKDEEVMEGLQPHSNLKALVVENFRGKRFSQWLSSGLYCNNLTHLALADCKMCEQLPTLGCLRYLKSLGIYGMESVEVIGSDFFYTSDQRVAACSSTESSLFPQLKEITMSNMPKLKEWFDPVGSCASAFPCLESLSINNCPLLLSVPTCFHSLQRLGIKGINNGEPLLMILSNSYNLTALQVENVQQLTCLSEPLLKCTSLRLLEIKGCKELVELPSTLQSLGCLEILEINTCDSLTSLPVIEGLLSLRDLTIFCCENITDTPSGLESCVSVQRLIVIDCPKLSFSVDLASFSHLRYLSFFHLPSQTWIPQWLSHLSNLTSVMIGGFNKELDKICGIDQLPKSLKVLRLVGWQKLKSLPDELQSLSQLETLALWHFDGVIALPEWLGNLSSLQSLQINYCINVKHLPSLDAMRSLACLTELKIKGCPFLAERCRKEGGEEWHKISQLPRILINEEQVADEEFDDGKVCQKFYWMCLLTGRKPFDSSRPRSEQSLVQWATPQLHDIDALTKMVDLALEGLYPIKSLSRFADVIALCVQTEPELRPPMLEVVQGLVRLVQRANMSKRTVRNASRPSENSDESVN